MLAIVTEVCNGSELRTNTHTVLGCPVTSTIQGTIAQIVTPLRNTWFPFASGHVFATAYLHKTSLIGLVVPLTPTVTAPVTIVALLRFASKTTVPLLEASRHTRNVIATIRLKLSSPLKITLEVWSVVTVLNT